MVNSSARSSVRGGGTLSSPTVCALGTAASSSSSCQLLGDGKVVFWVQVLRGDLPEEITSRGATSQDPIVIVDN